MTYKTIPEQAQALSADHRSSLSKEDLRLVDRIVSEGDSYKVSSGEIKRLQRLAIQHQVIDDPLTKPAAGSMKLAGYYRDKRRRGY